jgi:SAM-dependent methyltransferase
MVVDLGLQPLANNLPRPEDLGRTEPRFPLRLFVCSGCWLLQISDLVPPTELFSEYLYFSSFSEAMLRHAREATERYCREFQLGEKSFVVEIASNDGYLLQNFQRWKIPCVGIEPAANIARVAMEKGIETIVDFFGAAFAERLAQQRGQADLILGNNVFAHAPEINDFIAGLKSLLKPDGQIVLEFPYAGDLVEKTEFDTIYHEHVFYFSLTPLLPLFARLGLSIFRVEKLAIHGGSLRIFAGHAGAHEVDDSVTALLAEESARGIDTLRYYESFSERVHSIRDALRERCAELKNEGATIAAYGAAAKGSTLLNFCGIGHDVIDFVADRNSYKQGRLMPGVHIPIVPAEELNARMPAYTLLLVWNFAEEILEQQRPYRAAGGKFMIPLPQLAVV